MRLVLQRVTSAAVSWESERNEIGLGLAILVGVGPGDDKVTATRLAEKVVQLRLFQDAEGKTNLSLQDVRGEALVVSQFTLYADLSRGRRPGFTGAAAPELAEALVTSFGEAVRRHGVRVEQGVFG